jgi:hypothetical protein
LNGNVPIWEDGQNVGYRTQVGPTYHSEKDSAPLRLSTNQSKRLSSFEKWFNKMVQYQKSDLTIIDTSQNCIAGEFRKRINDAGFTEYVEYHEFGSCLLFEVNQDYDHGLYTSLPAQKKELSIYRVFKELKV